jgi:hypothetical protein
MIKMGDYTSGCGSDRIAEEDCACSRSLREQVVYDSDSVSYS